MIRMAGAGWPHVKIWSILDTNKESSGSPSGLVVDEKCDACVRVKNMYKV